MRRSEPSSVSMSFVASPAVMRLGCELDERTLPPRRASASSAECHAGQRNRCNVASRATARNSARNTFRDSLDAITPTPI